MVFSNAAKLFMLKKFLTIRIFLFGEPSGTFQLAQSREPRSK